MKTRKQKARAELSSLLDIATSRSNDLLNVAQAIHRATVSASDPFAAIVAMTLIEKASGLHNDFNRAKWAATKRKDT